MADTQAPGAKVEGFRLSKRHLQYAKIGDMLRKKLPEKIAQLMHLKGQTKLLEGDTQFMMNFLRQTDKVRSKLPFQDIDQ